MTTKTIKRGKAGFTIEAQRPDKWSHDSSVTVSVVDSSTGDDIITDQPVTVYAGDTLAQAEPAGSYELVLATGNEVNGGDVLRVGSDQQGYQTVKVKYYLAASNTIELVSSLYEPLIAGSTVAGQSMSAVIDASDSAFDDVSEVQVDWESDGDGLTMSQTWRVLSFENQPDGLSASFQAAYPVAYDAVGGDGIAELSRRAEQVIINHFNAGLRDYDKVRDNELTKEALMAKMALLSGTGADMGDRQWERIEALYKECVETLDNLPIWTDDDEDGIKDNDEVRKAVVKSWRRGL